MSTYKQPLLVEDDEKPLTELQVVQWRYIVETYERWAELIADGHALEVRAELVERINFCRAEIVRAAGVGQ